MMPGEAQHDHQADQGRAGHRHSDALDAEPRSQHQQADAEHYQLNHPGQDRAIGPPNRVEQPGDREAQGIEEGEGGEQLKGRHHRQPALSEHSPDQLWSRQCQAGGQRKAHPDERGIAEHEGP